MEYSNLFVCLMGICTVFIGLICIILLVSIMSGIIRKTSKDGKNDDVPARAVSANATTVSASPASGGEVTAPLVAAVAAAIAQDMGTDANGLRILSFKKV